MNYITRYDSPNYWDGQNSPQEVVLHHWGADGQSFSGVVNWLCNPRSKVSAHYVVGGNDCACIVNEGDAAWHAGSAWHNRHSIGIEARPEMDATTYKTVIETVAMIYKHVGRVLPVIGHRDIVSTACPGRWYPHLKDIQTQATALYQSGRAPSAPSTTTTSNPSASTPKGNANVKKAQQAINRAARLSIATDGIIGQETRRGFVKVLQKCLNNDYGARLVVDGIIGSKTLNALGNHYVRRGETQYLVTAVEIGLMLLGYYTGGVEVPGQFGAGMDSATRSFQRAKGLYVDGSAGHDTIRAMLRELRVM